MSDHSQLVHQVIAVYPRVLVHLRKSAPSMLLLWLAALLLCGCGALVVAGAGAGAFSYYSGNLVRNYEVDYSRAVRAGSKVMKQLKFTEIGKRSDGLKTVLTAKRADGAPVTIVVERVDSRLTRVGVRNGLIGVSNVEASKQVHQRIGQQLNRTRVAGEKTGSLPAKQIEVGKTKIKLTDQPPESISETIQGSEQQASVPVMASPGQVATPASSLPRSTLYIYYNNNEDTIPVSAHDTLDRVAGYLAQRASASVEIRAYTDSKGDPESNLKISKNRAHAVKKYLLARGVAPGQVSAEGYGATNFLASNRTENLRAMNRRVELQIR